MNNKIITFLDLIQEEDFRSFVEKRLISAAGFAYSFPKSFPKIYRYRSLSSYHIKDIISGQITLSSIGEFNDVFDGAIHQYGNNEEINKAAEEKWTQMENHRIAANLPETLLKKEDIVKPYIDYYKRESRLKFRELDYLGTYVGCFSQVNNSTVMWAHYADSSKGFCVEYDFNRLPADNLIRKSLFPVAYTKFPVDVNDLMNDEGYKIYKYPLDAAVLCSALNKADIWSYEHEWRFVWVITALNERYRYFSINSTVNPSKVYLGYHFLKPFFYYNFKDEKERNDCSERISIFLELLVFLQKNNIPTAIMRPSVGNYNLKSIDISSGVLSSFIQTSFKDNRPEGFRFYYTVHDRLMRILDDLIIN